METVRRQEKILSFVRWLGVPLGMGISSAIFMLWGEMPAVIIGLLATVSFATICDKARNNVLFEHIRDAVKKVVESIGNAECIFEFKRLRAGIIVRVYLMGCEIAPEVYAEAITSMIKRSWYERTIWATQIAPIDAPEDMRDVSIHLNGELLARIEYEKVRQSAKQRTLIEKQRSRMTGERRYYDGTIKKVDEGEKVNHSDSVNTDIDIDRDRDDCNR